MYALAKANQLEQEATIEREVIGAQYFECPDIECGAVFSYCRVSCGRFVQPDFCPICGGPMKAAKEILRTICQTGSAGRIFKAPYAHGQETLQRIIGGGE